jgi:hypothetical protein
MNLVAAVLITVESDEVALSSWLFQQQIAEKSEKEVLY